MQKPKRTGKRRAWLSRTVGKTLRKYGGFESEPTVVRNVVSDYLLEKLMFKDKNLASARLRQAKMLAGRIAAVEEAIALTRKKQPVLAKNARKIIQRALNEMPAYKKRTKEKLSEKQLAELKAFEQRLVEKLRQIEDLPDEQLATLSPGLLETVNKIHLDELKHLLGEKNFKLYANAMGRARERIRKRKKK